MNASASKILVVDDNANDRFHIVKMLYKLYRHENILEAENGKVALELYNQHSPDIILTDIRMPVMDGIEMISKIRESDDYTVIIIISAFEKQIYDYDSLNISNFILKPVTVLHLYTVLDQYLE